MRKSRGKSGRRSKRWRSNDEYVKNFAASVCCRVTLRILSGSLRHQINPVPTPGVPKQPEVIRAAIDAAMLLGQHLREGQTTTGVALKMRRVMLDELQGAAEVTSWRGLYAPNAGRPSVCAKTGALCAAPLKSGSSFWRIKGLGSSTGCFLETARKKNRSQALERLSRWR